MVDIVDLLSTLVSYKTVNDPVRGIKPGRECASFIRDTLVDWGLAPSIIERNGFYSVYGCIGRGRPCLLFMAHYDTVPADPSEWSHDPFKLTIENSRGYGRGALDDKSNVAALMLTLHRLSRERLGCRVFYVFTGDEEIGGTYGAYFIAELMRREDILPRYLVNADGIGMNIIIRRRKAFKITARARSIKKAVRGIVVEKEFRAGYPISRHVHAAYFIPGLDTHPLIAASVYARERGLVVRRIEGSFMKSNVVPARVRVEYVEPRGDGEEVEYDAGLTDLLGILLPLTRIVFETEKPSDYGVTITPNMYYVERGSHTIEVDVRAMLSSKEPIERAVKSMLGIVGIDTVELSIATGPGCYLYTSPSSPLVKAFIKASKSIGIAPRLAEGAGASDSRYFTVYGVEAVDYGPTGGNIHGPDEYVDLGSLRLLPEIYYKVAKAIVAMYSR